MEAGDNAGKSAQLSENPYSVTPQLCSHGLRHSHYRLESTAEKLSGKLSRRVPTFGKPCVR